MTAPENCTGSPDGQASRSENHIACNQSTRFSVLYFSETYLTGAYRENGMFRTVLKKGSMELLVLSFLTDQPRHGYDIGQLIEKQSGGKLRFRISSLYPVLCRMEKRGWITGRWVEKKGQHRRRYYHLTTRGEEILAEQRAYWNEFTTAVNTILEANNA